MPVTGDDPMVDRSPIVRGDGERGVMLLHGLTGGPHEVRPVAEGLAEAGYAVRAPMLPGHADAASLETTTWRDWYAGIEETFEALHDGGRRRVVVAGFSMGSLLALRLAALRPRELEGLVVASVPLRLPRWQARAVEAMSKLRRRPLLGRLVGMLPKDGPDIRDAHARRTSPSLRRFPYPALAQLVQLQDEVDGLLELVRAPLLLLHGRHDHTAPVELSAVVAQRVSSPSVRRVVLEESFHVVALDVERARVCAEILAFVRATLGPASTPH